MNKIYEHVRLNLDEGKHLTAEHHTVTFDLSHHWHTFFEIEIILSGKGKCFLNDDVYDLSEENVFLLSPTDFHHYEIETNIPIINISFDERMLSEKDLSTLVFKKSKKAYALNVSEHKRIVSAGELLVNEYEQSGDCQRALLSYILHFLFRKNEYGKEKSLAFSGSEGIKRALIYMQLRFKENITLTSVAEAVGYHPTYFSELFRRVTGETYLEALTRLRVEYAASLLTSGFLVSDVCFLSGFGSLSNFLESFKRYYGMTPSAYRAANAKYTLKLKELP